MSNTRFIRNALYQFKKNYGTEIRYVSIVQSDVNPETGQRRIDKRAYTFEVILLPTTLMRKFVQDIGYLAANKNFTYGGLNDYITTSFLIMGEDFPVGLEPNLDGYIVHDHKRFEKVQLTKLEHGVGYLLVAKGVEGSLPYDVASLVAQNQLQFSQTVRYELN